MPSSSKKYLFKYYKIQKERKILSLAFKKLSTEVYLCTYTGNKNFIIQEQSFVDGKYEETFKMKCQVKVNWYILPTYFHIHVEIYIKYLLE